jgi:hypothetical protein
MSPKLPDLFGRASTVSADHAHLRAIWARLRKLFTSEPTGAVPRDEKWQLICEFTSEVTLHFAAEEAEGHFGALEAQCHELRPRISKLREEHAQITVRINELLAARGTLEPSELDAKLRSLLEQFQLHETGEAALLQEFFGRDNVGLK